jgi:cytochrome c oxidase subunit II
LRRPPAPKRSKLRNAALLCGLTALALLAFAPDAFANFITPQSGGSPNANKISDLYTLTLIIAAVIFVGVEGTLFYTLVRFRKRKGRVAVQIHGNTRLEIGWTVGAAVVLVALASVTFAELHSIRTPAVSGPNGLSVAQGAVLSSDDALKPPRGPYITVQVNGQQYVWRFTYLRFGRLADQLDDPYTYYHLYVPTNTTVVLKVVSQDVVHSWWIPDLGGKVQAVPGYTNWTSFKISRPYYTYTGQCAFLCGRGHATMRAEVTALPPKQWLAWLHNLEAALQANKNGGAAGRAALKNRSGSAAVENP